MKRNKQEEKDFKSLSLKHNISAAEVRRAVYSYISTIIAYVKKTPLDNPQRIYSKERFEELAKVWNLPSLGRIGLSYSRYLRWRSNEAKDVHQEPRSRFRCRISQDDIEHMAEEILAGNTPSPLKKRKAKELYNPVWLVGKDGKRLARQVIPKERTNED